ncbi:Arrestin domain-containing protein 2 [Mortierella alpina]|nr:Arrestin domain-containing protein 2 [Mortierella alpina]
MNFLFSTGSGSHSPSTHTHTPALSCNTSAAVAAASTATSAHSPTTPTPAAQQDVELVIDIESSFHGVLLGLPEDSPGAVLNATAILHVRKKPIRASKLTATFDGRIKVQCSDGATFGSEQYRERVLAHKDWVLWEAGANNIHSTAAGSGSKNHIPVGTHYYPLSIQLDGALPPSFSGKHGSIRYILTSTLLRPLFYSDINAVQEIEIKRCLVNESALAYGTPIQQSSQLDLGSLLVSQLSRAGISGALNSRSSEAMEAMAADVPLGPTTITHHNTHKELLRYTATSPPIAHLEGGLIQVDLALEPLPPGSYVYSIAYGLKELIHYRSSATGNLADNKSEILYPIGQQTVIIPRDLERERSMSSAGAGASTRQLLELRPCPLLTNVDILTPLIEIHHRITCNVAIVLADNTLNGDNQSDQATGSSTGGGGILRRLNLAPQPLAPSLNLIDSSGAEAVNNAVLLGEPTLSIIEPALMPATVELNDAPPPPPSSQIESTLLEFPIILTSRYPSFTRGPGAGSHSVIDQDHEDQLSQGSGNEADFAYHALNTHNYPSPNHANPADTQPTAPVLQQFVHNQEIAPTIIPTTGTAIQTTGGAAVASMLSRSISASSSSSHLSTMVVGDHNESSSSSLQPSPLTPSTASGLLPSHPTLLDTPVPNQLMAGSSNQRVLAQSGLSAGLRAAAAAAAAMNSGSSVDPTENEPQSRPPSYGRQGPQTAQGGNPSPDELPKYEDVMDQADHSDAGLGITVPQSIPMPMPMHIPSRGDRSTSARSLGVSHSPVLHQSMGSHPRGRVLASPPSLSPVVPSTSAGFAYDREVHGSSPPMIRGHARSGSTTSILQSTSLARSPGQSMSPFLTMTPTQSSPLQQQFTAPSSMHRQTSIGHQRQQQHQHQRQRSVGAATIMGSLGCNGGYLSQQPVHLSMSDCVAPSPILVSDRRMSPPAYAE